MVKIEEFVDELASFIEKTFGQEVQVEYKFEDGKFLVNWEMTKVEATFPMPIKVCEAYFYISTGYEPEARTKYINVNLLGLPVATASKDLPLDKALEYVKEKLSSPQAKMTYDNL